MPSSEVEQPGTVAVRQPWSWTTLVLAVACALAYAVFFVLPYYVNDMGRYPLAEVASAAHDASLLWPYDTPLAGPFGLGALATLTLGPFVAGGVLVWAVVGLWLQRSTTSAADKGRLIVAAIVAAGTLAWLTSDFASALISWWLD